MGRLKPVRAVTSDCGSLEECLASGADLAALLDSLGALEPNAVTLHIGSGLGRIEYHLHTRVARCHGLDVSKSMVRHARKLVPFENVEFHCTDGRGLSSWPDGSFHLVYSFLVFQHLPRSQFLAYVSDAHAKLIGDGRFVFQMMVDETGATPEPPVSHPYALRRYRRDEVEQALVAAGFTHIRRTSLHGEADDGSRPTADIVFSAKKG